MLSVCRHLEMKERASFAKTLEIIYLLLFKGQFLLSTLSAQFERETYMETNRIMQEFTIWRLH